MNVIYIVLPLALVLSGVAVWAFLWATRRGQFDDLNTPAMRILHEDEAEPSAPGNEPSKAATERRG